MVAVHPADPMLPLESSTSTRSILVKHSVGKVGLRGHGSTLHSLRWSLSSPSTGGHSPRPTASFLTARLRSWWPMLHALVHSDHWDHRASSQGTSHAWTLQAMVSVRAPQGFPAYLGWTVTVLMRSCTPPSQSAEQLLKGAHSDTSQS